MCDTSQGLPCDGEDVVTPLSRTLTHQVHALAAVAERDLVWLRGATTSHLLTSIAYPAAAFATRTALPGCPIDLNLYVPAGARGTWSTQLLQVLAAAADRVATRNGSASARLSLPTAGMAGGTQAVTPIMTGVTGRGRPSAGSVVSLGACASTISPSPVVSAPTPMSTVSGDPHNTTSASWHRASDPCGMMEDMRRAATMAAAAAAVASSSGATNPIGHTPARDGRHHSATPTAPAPATTPAVDASMNEAYALPSPSSATPASASTGEGGTGLATLTPALQRVAFPLIHAPTEADAIPDGVAVLGVWYCPAAPGHQRLQVCFPTHDTGISVGDEVVRDPSYGILVEMVNAAVGQDDLFKRALLLLRSWLVHDAAASVGDAGGGGGPASHLAALHRHAHPAAVPSWAACVVLLVWVFVTQPGRDDLTTLPSVMACLWSLVAALSPSHAVHDPVAPCAAAQECATSRSTGSDDAGARARANVGPSAQSHAVCTVLTSDAVLELCRRGGAEPQTYPTDLTPTEQERQSKAPGVSGDGSHPVPPAAPSTSAARSSMTSREGEAIMVAGEGETHHAPTARRSRTKPSSGRGSGGRGSGSGRLSGGRGLGVAWGVDGAPALWWMPRVVWRAQGVTVYDLFNPTASLYEECAGLGVRADGGSGFLASAAHRALCHIGRAAASAGDPISPAVPPLPFSWLGDGKGWRHAFAGTAAALDAWPHTPVGREVARVTGMDLTAPPPTTAGGAAGVSGGVVSHGDGTQVLEDLTSVVACGSLMQHASFSRDAVLLLARQILARRGPLPVGEIGKLMHDATNAQAFMSGMKSRYGGLKKFLEAHPHLFIVDRSHAYNPIVHLNRDGRVEAHDGGDATDATTDRCGGDAPVGPSTTKGHDATWTGVEPELGRSTTPRVPGPIMPLAPSSASANAMNTVARTMPASVASPYGPGHTVACGGQSEPGMEASTLGGGHRGDRTPRSLAVGVPTVADASNGSGGPDSAMVASPGHGRGSGVRTPTLPLPMYDEWAVPRRRDTFDTGEGVHMHGGGGGLMDGGGCDPQGHGHSPVLASSPGYAHLTSRSSTPNSMGSVVLTSPASRAAYASGSGTGRSDSMSGRSSGAPAGGGPRHRSVMAASLPAGMGTHPAPFSSPISPTSTVASHGEAPDPPMLSAPHHGATGGGGGGGRMVVAAPPPPPPAPTNALHHAVPSTHASMPRPHALSTGVDGRYGHGMTAGLGVSPHNHPRDTGPGVAMAAHHPAPVVTRHHPAVSLPPHAAHGGAGGGKVSWKTGAPYRASLAHHATPTSHSPHHMPAPLLAAWHDHMMHHGRAHMAGVEGGEGGAPLASLHPTASWLEHVPAAHPSHLHSSSPAPPSSHYAHPSPSHFMMMAPGVTNVGGTWPWPQPSPHDLDPPATDAYSTLHSAPPYNGSGGVEHGHDPSRYAAWETYPPSSSHHAPSTHGTHLDGGHEAGMAASATVTGGRMGYMPPLPSSPPFDLPGLSPLPLYSIPESSPPGGGGTAQGPTLPASAPPVRSLSSESSGGAAFLPSTLLN